MPVTVRPANHRRREWHVPPATSSDKPFQYSCRSEADRCHKIIQSSFGGLTAAASVSASENGFIYAAISAYNQHHHLTIRPEDVWFAILTQLGFYINANAEKLRSLFVAHEGKKELNVIDGGTVHTADFGRLAVQMTEEIEKNVVDSELREWIMPNFTTTTPKTDTITAAILMMGSMQSYFSYKITLMCGIPSVTLLSEKADWVAIRKRLDKLLDFGQEAQQFSHLLTPVLDFFVRTFEDPGSPEVEQFWSKIAHKESNGSGPVYLSGWLTAFCFWDAKGRVMDGERAGGCEINGVQYRKLDTNDIPVGYVSVPVTVDDNGHEIKTRMVAGSVGIAASSSGDQLDTHDTYAPAMPEAGKLSDLDSLQPVSGW
ncbi:hypothetical protein F5Y17DRAFT_425324 [Xylariaceae sp. FL0594]|nr:hypothetical protein F5Y17DRAFT_425324 [Xylariaceae sp. FL0594]